MPRYSSKITFNHNQTYTAPCDGYVFNHTNPQPTHYLRTDIDGIIFEEYSYDGNNYNAHTHFIAVSKGTKFVTKHTSNTRWFVPTVGAVLSGDWKGSL